MKQVYLLAAILLILAGTTSGASAVDITDILTSTTTAEILVLQCTNNALPGGLNGFSYLLTNPASNTVHIGGFTIEFPGVPAVDFAVTQTPTGWINGIVISESKINWKWIDFANPGEQLDPGESFQFAFTTTLPFGSDDSANASAQNGHGFSGETCGPASIVPEASSLMLGLMGLGSVAGLVRLRRR